MPSGTRWTEKEINLIKERYPTASWSDWKKWLPHRTQAAIRFQAYKLGVKKKKAYYEYESDYNANNGALLKHLSERQKGYLAGILDGEGTFGLYKTERGDERAPVYRFVIQVVNTDKKLINWLVDKIPGNSYTRKQGERDKNWRRTYLWTLTGSRRVMQFCEEIAPYLLLKRQQAELISDGYVHLSYKERDKLVERLKQLKRSE